MLLIKIIASKTRLKISILMTIALKLKATCLTSRLVKTKQQTSIVIAILHIYKIYITL